MQEGSPWSIPKSLWKIEVFFSFSFLFNVGVVWCSVVWWRVMLAVYWCVRNVWCLVKCDVSWKRLGFCVWKVFASGIWCVMTRAVVWGMCDASWISGLLYEELSVLQCGECYTVL